MLIYVFYQKFLQLHPLLYVIPLDVLLALRYQEKTDLPTNFLQVLRLLLSCPYNSSVAYVHILRIRTYLMPILVQMSKHSFNLISNF